MEQIVVPQFLDVEDKIIGSITVRQFIEILIGGMIIFIFYKIFDFSLFVVSGLAIIIVTIVFAFVKIGGQNFHDFLLNFISTMKNPKLKIWKKVVPSSSEIKAELKNPAENKIELPKTKRQEVSSSRLSELSLIVDTGGVYRGEGAVNATNNIFK